MIVNQRIRKIRLYRELTGQKLANMAGLSPAAISRIETESRLPRVDTLQKIAAAFDVSSSFLLGEEDSEVDLHAALSRQSLKKFLQSAKLSAYEVEYLEEVSQIESAPQTVQEWRDLLTHLTVYESMRKKR